MENKGNSFSLFKASIFATIIFTVLKLGGTVAWSWLLVFLPLIIYTGLALVLFIFSLFLAFIVIIFD